MWKMSIGKEAKGVLPVLERLLGDNEEDVRTTAAQALAGIRSEE
jgi:HEAT repeat protein